MVYDLMEKEAASTVDSDEAALQEEEELLMQALLSKHTTNLCSSFLGPYVFQTPTLKRMHDVWRNPILRAYGSSLHFL